MAPRQRFPDCTAGQTAEASRCKRGKRGFNSLAVLHHDGVRSSMAERPAVTGKEMGSNPSARPIAGLAQRKCSGPVNRRSGVQILQPAPYPSSCGIAEGREDRQASGLKYAACYGSRRAEGAIPPRPHRIARSDPVIMAAGIEPCPQHALLADRPGRAREPLKLVGQGSTPWSASSLRD